MMGALRAAAPIITSVSPASGSGSVPITITGTGFDTAQNLVFLGGTGGVCGLSYLASTASGTSIACTLGLGGWSAGTYALTVRNAVNLLTSNGVNFTVNAPKALSVTSVSPSSAAPGAALTIAGGGFDTTSTNVVRFSGPQGVNVTLSSTDGAALSVTVPSLLAGTYSVSVSNAAGQTAYAPSTIAITASTASGAPAITSVSPTSGSGKTAITITGTGFDASSNWISVGGIGIMGNYYASTGGGTQIAITWDSTGWSPGGYAIVVRNNTTNQYSNAVNFTVKSGPTAALTVYDRTNGTSGSSVTASVGDSLDYTWSSAGGSTYSSTYKGDLSYCGSGAWAATTASGTSNNNVVAQGSAGCTYTTTYTVTASDGTTATATLTIKVNGTAASSITPSTQYAAALASIRSQLAAIEALITQLLGGR